MARVEKVQNLVQNLKDLYLRKIVAASRRNCSKTRGGLWLRIPLMGPDFERKKSSIRAGGGSDHAGGESGEIEEEDQETQEVSRSGVLRLRDTPY